jgi:hypothetical protein
MLLLEVRKKNELLRRNGGMLWPACNTGVLLSRGHLYGRRNRGGGGVEFRNQPTQIWRETQGPNSIPPRGELLGTPPPAAKTDPQVKDGKRFLPYGRLSASLGGTCSVALADACAAGCHSQGHLFTCRIGMHTYPPENNTPLLRPGESP